MIFSEFAKKFISICQTMAATPGSRIADVKDGADTEKAMAASLEQFTRDYGEEEAEVEGREWTILNNNE